MKNVLSFVFIVLFVFVSKRSFACDIEVTSEKELYSLGETATLAVELRDTHRNCTFEGKEPKAKISGLEILAKTKYKEKSSGLWTIKYRVKILDAKNQFTVLRDNCPSGGGIKIMTLKTGGDDAKAREVKQ